MLVPIIFIIAFMAALAGALLESRFQATKIAQHDAVARYADATIVDGMADFTHGLATYIAAHGSGGPWPHGTSRSALRSACARIDAESACPYHYVISATITAASNDGSTDAAGVAPAAEAALNLQAAVINEQRLSAIVTTTLHGRDGAVAGSRTRFVTYRVFATAPFAVVAGARDITSAGGTESAPSGGDSGGTPATLSTGQTARAAADDTRIHVRLTCRTVIANVVPFANDQQPAGNDGLPWGNAAQHAYEVPCTSADAPADVFRDKHWINGDANRSGWTR